MLQCKFGAETSKPTRWMSNAAPFARHLYLGWPELDDQNNYKGPLPKNCGHQWHGALIGQKEGKFRTA
eukprot:2835415-Karenia_brevis.AAC.1